MITKDAFVQRGVLITNGRKTMEREMGQEILCTYRLLVE